MTSFEKAQTKKKSHKIINHKLERLKISMVNGKYKFYFFLLPIVLPIILIEELKNWNYKRMNWNETKATKILDHVLPKLVEYIEQDNAYYYNMDWGNYNLWHSAPLVYRNWARKFSYELKQYIKNEYEHESYIKTIEDDGWDVWIKFEKKC